MRPRVRGAYRLLGWLLIAVVWALAACAPAPTTVECRPREDACDDGCTDLASDADNCGACGTRCTTGVCVDGACQGTGPCATNNGGCSSNAECMELGGQVMCLCDPGFTGDGFACTACTLCDANEFITSPCTPFADATCATCAPACESGQFEAQVCGPLDRICALCSFCTIGQYQISPCAGSQDAVCGQCELGCTTCTGPGATCIECENGFILQAGVCMPPPQAFCSNGIIEPTEACDDGNPDGGDGCSSLCQVEVDHYCFGAPSSCHPGGCVFEPATSLPLGPAFALDGAGTTSGAGLQFTERSSIYTTSDVSYPVLIEADVVYSGDDITVVGSRGSGLLDTNNSDLQAASLRARLYQCCGFPLELVTDAGNVGASTTAPFTPSLGTPYRVRYFDDGFLAVVEWFNLTNPSEGVGLPIATSFHGGGDRAFIGGGNQGGVTVSNVRVCDAPELPVTAGLSARYSAIPSWTAVRDPSDNVSQWQDSSGNGHHISEAGPLPVFAGGAIGGPHAGLDFGGNARLSSSPFMLTTDVTVFAVIKHRNPALWGAIAHHGHRDDDWSLEQSGDSGDPNVLHWQTNNDIDNVELTLDPNADYILTGRFDGNARYFSASALVGSSPAPVSIVDANHTISPGDKPLFVGTSNLGEASNAIIGEIIYYARALTDFERDAVIAYLRAVWQP